MQNFKTEFDTSQDMDFKSELLKEVTNFETKFGSVDADFDSAFSTSFVSDFETEIETAAVDFKTEFKSVVASGTKEEKQEKTVTITENGTVEILPDLNMVLEKVTIITDIIGADVEEYKGSCQIVPKFEEQVLPTCKKVLRDDVVIKEIPITKVSNTSGGNTVIIGG